MGLPPAALAGVAAGSILPDVLDMALARLLVFRQLAFNRIHRGATHWFGWWLALLVAGLVQLKPVAVALHLDARAVPWALGLVPEATLFALGLGFGGLAHVLLDFCTVMGVPVAPWTRKHMVSLNLCKTGSLREYAFLAATLALFGVLAREDLLNIADMARKHLP